jgi:predicted amidohydrolase
MSAPKHSLCFISLLTATLLMSACQSDDAQPSFDRGLLIAEDQGAVTRDGAQDQTARDAGLDQAPNTDLLLTDGPGVPLDQVVPKVDLSPAKDVAQAQDQAIPKDAEPPIPDFGAAPVATKVAAIQYGEGQAGFVDTGCATNPAPNLCAIKMLVLQARAGGASFVVIPEYSLIPDQQYWEPLPALGVNPGTSSAWPEDLFITIFSKYAKKLDIYLVINLLTFDGTKPNYKYYNTQVAFEPSGKVVGVHRKFELFGNEQKSLTPGNDVMVFSTPLGKIGLLICADIYGDSTLLDKLAYTLGARVVAFSSFWTVASAVTWQQNFAKKYGVFFIAANTTINPGQGGGVYDPNGAALAQKIQNQPSVVFADIPLP